MVLFPFVDYWWFYAAFTAFILVVLALDLGVFHKAGHEVSFREASIWTTIWIAMAMLFNLLFYFYAKYKFTTNENYLSLPNFDGAEQAKARALEFLTGYVVEKSLAVDNIFVFAIVFAYFGIPKAIQHRILFWGILGALLFRAIFIAAGSILLNYKLVVIFFGALLVITGIKLLLSSHKPMDLSQSSALKILNKFLRIHPHIEGQKFFIVRDGLTYVTPAFLALIIIELSDVLFSIDSVPAIFALTREPLIVFTSNILAVLGLRSMYFLLAGAMDRFAYIKYGLASVLVFVGLKMLYLNEHFGGKFPTLLSLAIIGVLVGASIAASLLLTPKHQGS